MSMIAAVLFIPFHKLKVDNYNYYYYTEHLTMYCHLVKFPWSWVRDGEPKARSHRRRPDFTVAWALRPRNNRTRLSPSLYGAKCQVSAERR